MLRALDIITSAYKRMNRLSPGEVLIDDDSAYALPVLNELVDELTAQNEFLFLQVLTSAAQSGPITLGQGAWSSVSPGDEVVSMTADNLPLNKLTMQQYNELYQPTATGRPTVWASDGLNTIYLWPVPTGQVIKMQTRGSVTAFADLTTSYTAPDGWKAALSAGLAVRIAPAVIGRLPPELVRAEKQTMSAVNRYEPAIIGVDSYTKPRPGYYPPRLF